MLRSIGIEHIVDASDGDIALSILRDRDHIKLRAIPENVNENCLFILLDWVMPRMSGINFAQEIRADQKLENTPMIMITGEKDREQIVQASAEIGVNAYILKPFGINDIEGKISNVVKLRANPPEHVKLVLASETLKKQGRYDESLELLNKALQVAPNSARIHVMRGELLKNKGEYEEARNSFAQATALNPDYLKTYEATADLYLREGKKDLALSSLQKASEISPRNAERQTTIGEIFLEKGDEKEAQKAFDGAIKQNPKMAKEIAEVFLKNGNSQQAEEYFRKSLPTERQNLSEEEIKEYVHTANRLGIALRRQNKLREAIEEYKKARKLAPDDEAIYFNMGKAYMVLWEKEKMPQYFQKAQKCLNKAIKLDPHFEEAKKELTSLENTR